MYKKLIALSVIAMALLISMYLSDQGKEPAPLDDDDSANNDDDSGRYDRLPPLPKD